jgi:ATP-dependent Clp protease adaptor protein ClpS
MTEVVEPVLVPDTTKEKDPKFKDFLKILTPTQGKQDPTPEEPPMWAVILWNDNSTNPYFVLKILIEAFKISREPAWNIVMSTHRGTRNVVAVMSKDEAETRLMNAESMIQQAQPDVDWYTRHSPHCELKFTIEEETKGDNRA